MNKDQNQDKNNKIGKILYIFIAFFAIFISADIFLIYLAKTTWRGTVTENSYEKGRKYNQALLNDKKQKDLGWKGQINTKTIGAKKALLSFDLRDENNKIIDSAQVKIKIVRITQTGFDFDDELMFNTSNGSYQKEIIFPLAGLWKVEIQAFAKGEVFQYVKRVVITNNVQK